MPHSHRALASSPNSVSSLCAADLLPQFPTPNMGRVTTPTSLVLNEIPCTRGPGAEFCLSGREWSSAGASSALRVTSGILLAPRALCSPRHRESDSDPFWDVSTDWTLPGLGPWSVMACEQPGLPLCPTGPGSVWAQLCTLKSSFRPLLPAPSLILSRAWRKSAL